MDDLERGVGGLGLHKGVGVTDDSGFDEASIRASMASEKLPLPSITFNANPSLTGHRRGIIAGHSSLDDLTASIGQVTVASYTAADLSLTPMGSRRGSDAGLSGHGHGHGHGHGTGEGHLAVVGAGLGGSEVGSMFSVSAGGGSVPGSFFCAM